MQALGTIIVTTPREPTSDEIHCGLFDYYDHWSEMDPRLALPPPRPTATERSLHNSLSILNLCQREVITDEIIRPRLPMPIDHNNSQR